MGSRKVSNLIGVRFGMLVVLAHAGSNKRGYALWNCICDCGVEKVVLQNSLRSGNTRSCGSPQCWPKGALKHGHSRGNTQGKSSTYNSWQAMKQRCLDPNAARYPTYGGLGVTVCNRWKDSFENFLADLGERPPGTTLGRFGDVGNYEIGNVKWMTSAEQRENWKPDRNLGVCRKKSVEQIAA
jgi:hypothetical protein